MKAIITAVGLSLVLGCTTTIAPVGPVAAARRAALRDIAHHYREFFVRPPACNPEYETTRKLTDGSTFVVVAYGSLPTIFLSRFIVSPTGEINHMGSLFTCNQEVVDRWLKEEPTASTLPQTAANSTSPSGSKPPELQPGLQWSVTGYTEDLRGGLEICKQQGRLEDYLVLKEELERAKREKTILETHDPRLAKLMDEFCASLRHKTE
jgi:hypothetical protein